MAEFAKVIRVERVGGKYALTVDGEEFPWFVGAHITVDIDVNANPEVTVRLLAERVELVDEPKQVHVLRPLAIQEARS